MRHQFTVIFYRSTLKGVYPSVKIYQRKCLEEIMFSFHLKKWVRNLIRWRITCKYSKRELYVYRGLAKKQVLGVRLCMYGCSRNPHRKWRNSIEKYVWPLYTIPYTPSNHKIQSFPSLLFVILCIFLLISLSVLLLRISLPCLLSFLFIIYLFSL